MNSTTPFTPSQAIELPSLTERPLVRSVIVGHVDHGKSTLIGRLLHESGGISEAKLAQLKEMSVKRGMTFEWAFLLDALQAERDQGITIDTSQIRLRTENRDVVLIDAPGHTEFLRNMITGAAQADAALLMVDATEGMREQTRRHGHLLHLLGIRQVAVVVNKMDSVNFDEDRFRTIEKDVSAHLVALGISPVAVVPISARSGEGVARKSAALSWYDGPTIIAVLDRFTPARPAEELPLRFPVQAVYKFDDKRIIAGRIETGQIRVGDAIAIAPTRKVARIRSIEAWPAPNPKNPPQAAYAGQSVGIMLDRDIFLERGDVISLTTQRPHTIQKVRARIFWLHENPLTPGTAVTVRIGTGEARAVVTALNQVIDPGAVEVTKNATIAQNQIGDLELTLSRPLAADPHTLNPRTGRLALDIGGQIAGGGLILMDQAAANDVADAGEQLNPYLDESALISDASRLTKVLASLQPAERLSRLRREIGGKIVFTTSFGLEDQAITHLICEQKLAIDLVTLDTGRLFPETYELWAQTEKRYGIRIKAIYPDAADLEALIGQQGINGFYESQTARISCCHVRKVVPLNRALNGAQAWITGLRADQSETRGSAALVGAETARQVLKVSPFFDWTRADILSLAQESDVPLNPLHARGFASIGCAPCTRPIQPGEPERAGRWWWENEDKKECGLHR